MSGKRLTSHEKQRILDLLAEGRSLEEVARIVGRAKRTIFEVKHNPPPGARSAAQLRQLEANPPKTWDELNDLGKRCLESFPLFATTFFCLRTPRWWELAAEQLVEDVTNPDETYTLLHAPTGSGKTTLLEVLTAWLVSGGGSLDPETGRALRFLFGSSTLPKAIRSVDRLRRILEDPHPFYDPKQKRQAEHSLVEVYGRFKPTSDDDSSIWQQSQFTVAGIGDHPLGQRDPTLSAYSIGGATGGRNASPLSARAEIIVVDDPALMETVGDESLLERFEAEFESRLEPSGSLFAVGQRLHAQDLYGALAARSWSDDQGDESPTYTVVSFPAHRDHEGNDHVEWTGRDGCLLDPIRLPWRKLQRESAKTSYLPMFQQDVESSNALGLVERAWIDGIVDSTGYVGPGCWDDREFHDYVHDENGRPLPCYVSVDPAQGGDSFWSLETWQVDPRTRKRFLIAGRRGRFNIREVLNDDAEGFGGVLHELVLQSVTAGARPVAIVIESNAAKHFLQSQLFAMFKAFFLPEALLVPFQTTAPNKSSPITGVTALLQPAYRGGEVRLPRRGEWGYLKAKIEELTSPRPKHTDCTMSEWCGAASLDKIIVHAARTRRGPTPTVRFGGKYREPTPTRPQVMTGYGAPSRIAALAMSSITDRGVHKAEHPEAYS